MSPLKRWWCALWQHNRAEWDALGSTMGGSGPRYLYQCKRCGDYFTRRWE